MENLLGFERMLKNHNATEVQYDELIKLWIRMFRSGLIKPVSKPVNQEEAKLVRHLQLLYQMVTKSKDLKTVAEEEV